MLMKIHEFSQKSNFSLNAYSGSSNSKFELKGHGMVTYDTGICHLIVTRLFSLSNHTCCDRSPEAVVVASGAEVTTEDWIQMSDVARTLLMKEMDQSARGRRLRPSV